jgi:hypothetical protein
LVALTFSGTLEVLARR